MKPSKNYERQVVIRISQATYDQLQQIASEEEHTVAQIVRLAIRMDLLARQVRSSYIKPTTTSKDTP